MFKKISQHPTFTNTEDLLTLCKPLNKLNISYFCHVRIDDNDNFSGIGTDAKFAEHYLKNKYYNADIHLSKSNRFGKYVIWDAVHRTGLSEKMDLEAAQFGIRHTFTIIEKNSHYNDYFHFATDQADNAINQIYINNLDLLHCFIQYFKESVDQSKVLSRAFNIKFRVHPDAPGYTIKSGNDFEKMRFDFIGQINKNKSSELLTLPTDLSIQQINCLNLLMQGNSAKQIANQLHLSQRTVENYLQHIRKKMSCKSSLELIHKYKKITNFSR